MDGRTAGCQAQAVHDRPRASRTSRTSVSPKSSGVPRKCWPAHTIRTQSKSRGWGRAGAGPRVAQRDDMLDLQAAVTDDDALDYQLQDRLPLGDAGRVQPGADAVAEAGQAGQRLIGVDPSLAQPAMLLVVLLGDAALLGQGTTLPGEFLEADHLGLVGLQEAAVGTVEAVQSRPQPTPRELLAEIRRRALGQEPFELRPQLHGIAEQTRDVVPDHPFQDVRLEARLGALALTARGEGTRARAAVVAPAAPTLGPGKVAAVDAQPAGAALQQAAQQVVVPLAVAEGRGRIAGQPVLDAVPGLLIDQGRHRDGDPLLRRPGTSRGPLAAAGRAAAGLLRHDVLEAVRVGGAGVDRVGEDVVDHRGRPLLTPRPRGNARDQPAISAAMNASSQPAYLRLPFRLAFSVTSARARFSAILRRSARLRAAFRSRTRLASSRKVTSSTQCSPFSTRQWLRIAAASASGGSLALER